MGRRIHLPIHEWLIFPIGSMYGIFTCIYHKNQPNVGKYTIHGSYGFVWDQWIRKYIENLPWMRHEIDRLDLLKLVFCFSSHQDYTPRNEHIPLKASTSKGHFPKNPGMS